MADPFLLVLQILLVVALVFVALLVLTMVIAGAIVFISGTDLSDDDLDYDFEN